MQRVAWSLIIAAPVAGCLLVGYACCRGLRDPIVVALYHLFAYAGVLLGGLVVVLTIVAAIARRRGRDRPHDPSPFDPRW